MELLLRRGMDFLHSGGPSLLVIFVLATLSLALGVARRSRAAAAAAAVALLCAAAGSGLNGYACKMIERELKSEAPFAGRLPAGVMATVLMPDPWAPMLAGVVVVGLCFGLLRIGKRREGQASS